jgi:hypothetical protein
MKNLKKMLAVVTAVSAMAVSAPAFAAVSGDFTSANGAVTADYSAFDQNKVRATVDVSKAVVGKEMSFVVLDNDVTGSKITSGTIVADDILYIDQDTLGSSNYTFEANINLALVNGAESDATAIPAGSYPIRLGYYYDVNGTPTFAIAEATMVVEEDDSEKTITFIWGDVNANGAANGADATALVNAIAGGTSTWTKTVDGVTYTFGFNSDIVTADGKSYAMKIGDNSVRWGDVNINGAANGADATALVNAIAGGTSTWLGGVVEFNDSTTITLTE